MLFADSLLTSSKSTVSQEIETLNTSSFPNCYINQMCVGKYSEKRTQHSLATDNFLCSLPADTVYTPMPPRRPGGGKEESGARTERKA